MADNHNPGGNASNNQGSSNAAPNSAVPKPSDAENMASSTSAPGRNGQQGGRRGGRDQRGRGRGKERGKSRERGNDRGGRQKQDVGRSQWRYITRISQLTTQLTKKSKSSRQTKAQRPRASYQAPED
jgi:hypothetical protein